MCLWLQVLKPVSYMVLPAQVIVQSLNGGIFLQEVGAESAGGSGRFR